MLFKLDQLLEMLKRHEGLQLKVYKCPAGKLSVGYGRNLEDLGISASEAESLLKNDIIRVKNEVFDAFPWYHSLNTIRQDVIVNMAFNMGITKLRYFTNLISALERHNYGEAAKEMLDSKWAKQVGKRANELALMMKTGRYP